MTSLFEAGLTCPRCGDLAAFDATVCAHCGVRLGLTPTERYPRPARGEQARIRADIASRDRSRTAGRRHG